MFGLQNKGRSKSGWVIVVKNSYPITSPAVNIRSNDSRNDSSKAVSTTRIRSCLPVDTAKPLKYCLRGLSRII
jgi:hypothetical protein